MALKVLVPLDGSEETYSALDRALVLLRGRDGMRVTLFNVLAEGMGDDDRAEGFDEDEEDEIFATEPAARRMLERAESICRSHGVEYAAKIVTGKVATAILEECPNHDLLIMHALDKRQLKETLRGSQTERLARGAGISVLLVHS